MLLRRATYLRPDGLLAAADLRIEEGTLVAIRAPGTHPRLPDEIEGGPFIVIPGLVNAHFHGQSILSRGLTKDLTIAGWGADTTQGRTLGRLFHFLDHEASDDEIVAASVAGLLELLREGVTAVQDSGTAERSPLLVARALGLVGQRGLVDAYGEASTLPAEPEPFVRLAGHLPEEEDIDEAALARAAVVRGSPQGPGPEAGPAGRPMGGHCLETARREALVRERFGCSTVELFERRGLLEGPTLLFHLVRATAEDLAILARRGVGVAHCPESNLRSGAGLAPVGQMLAAGVAVGLGTDWGSTRYWETLRLAAGLLSETLEPAAAIPAAWRMATSEGARALGLGASVGRIAEGCAADLVLLDRQTLDLGPFLQDGEVDTAAHNLLFAGGRRHVDGVMVHGRWLLRGRRVLGLDEAAARARYAEVVERARAAMEVGA